MKKSWAVCVCSSSDLALLHPEPKCSLRLISVAFFDNLCSLWIVLQCTVKSIKLFGDKSRGLSCATLEEEVSLGNSSLVSLPGWPPACKGTWRAGKGWELMCQCWNTSLYVMLLQQSLPGWIWSEFEVPLQQGRPWQSLAGSCILPRLIPGQGPLWHQQMFHVLPEMLGTERSIKIQHSLAAGSRTCQGRAAAAPPTAQKDQVMWALQLLSTINSFLIQAFISVLTKGNLSAQDSKAKENMFNLTNGADISLSQKWYCMGDYSISHSAFLHSVC